MAFFGKIRDGNLKGVGFVSGNEDEVGVWTRALSAQNVTDLYNSGSGDTMVTTTGGSRRKIITVAYDWIKAEHPISLLA